MSQKSEAECWCNCGWNIEFDEGAMRRKTPLEQSAKARIAGHIANTGCPLNDTKFRIGGRMFYREHQKWKWKGASDLRHSLK